METLAQVLLSVFLLVVAIALVKFTFSSMLNGFCEEPLNPDCTGLYVPIGYLDSPGIDSVYVPHGILPESKQDGT